MPLPYVWVALPALQTRLKLSTQADNDRLELYASQAGEAIQQAAHRLFVSGTPATETRTFDAPAAVHLDVPDLWASPAPVVTLGGTTLVLGTDYALWPHTLNVLAPVYRAVIRLAGGFRRRWGYKPQGARAVVSVSVSRFNDTFLGLPLPYGPYGSQVIGTSEQTITIAGKYGYPVPGPVVFLQEVLTLRKWLRWQRDHALTMGVGSGGIANPVNDLPLLDDAELMQVLAPYVALPTDEELAA